MMDKPSIKTELVEAARKYVRERCGGLDRPHQLVIQFGAGGAVERVKVLDAPGDRVTKVEVVFNDGTRLTFNSTGRPDKTPKPPWFLSRSFRRPHTLKLARLHREQHPNARRQRGGCIGEKRPVREATPLGATSPGRPFAARTRRRQYQLRRIGQAPRPHARLRPGSRHFGGSRACVSTCSRRPRRTR
jgi:hypothetical protein